MTQALESQAGPTADRSWLRTIYPYSFAQWHQWKAGTIDWSTLQQGCRQIRQAFEASLQRVVELGCRRGE